MEHENLPKGLSHAEARRRLVRYGPNEVGRAHSMHGLADFLIMFKNPLVFILIFAAVLSASFGDWVSSVIIIVIVIISIALDFFNTYKSQKAAEALREHVRTVATVIRDDHQIDIPLRGVVPGDVVVLVPGDIIPADGEIIEARDFFINESSLTGESLPIERTTKEVIFMGASVVTGRAFMTVIKTGSQTKFGAIATSLAKQEDSTEFDRGMRDLGLLIIRITFLLAMLVFFLNALYRHTLIESLLFSTALAVGLTPELLPMIISINLSKGSLAMAKHGVIVKKLSAIQNIGNMDILCTDKTGTLTEDRIALVRCVDGSGEDSEEVFRYAYASSTYHTGSKNPLDTAVLEFKKLSLVGYEKIDEIPFDYARRRDTIVIEHAGQRTLITKGAPEEIFKICGTYGTDKKSLHKDIIEQAHAEYTRLSQDGFRVLALAVKTASDTKKIYDKADEQAMSFLGFIAFFDPPKATVSETLAMLERYGVGIKILTGDNEYVSQKIAKDIGLSLDGVLLGSELEALSDTELAKKVERITLFARVAPDQKTRIIKALQHNGHVVGYMGDGINDAPSLKAADVGISVNNAVDVAKESADFILIKKSLRDLIQAVVEGRKTFANTLKYLMMTLGSNFGNMFSMAGASIVLPFLPMTPVQILLNNLVYDSSQLALPTDNVDVEYIKKPRKFDIGFIERFMLIFGPMSSFFDLLTFLVLLYGFHLAGAGFQTGWFLESIATQTLVFYSIRTMKMPLWKSRPSRYVIVSSALVLLGSWGLALSPFGKLFGFTELPLLVVAVVAMITLLYIVVVERMKTLLYRVLVH